MREYTLSESRRHYGKILEQALREPIILTRHGRPSYVLLATDHLQEQVKLVEHALAFKQKNQAQTLEILDEIKAMWDVPGAIIGPIDTLALIRGVRDEEGPYAGC